MPRSLQSVEELQAVDAVERAIGGGLTQHKTLDIVEAIGEGGMGRVYRAFDPAMDRYVALKVLKRDVPEAERCRFRREAVVAADFSHPNLSRVLDRGADPARNLEWLTMDYLRGRDLGQIVDLGRSIPFLLVVDMFAQTLEALEYVHARGIVHCDVKPDNIFITRDPYDRRIVIVKLIDFGVCRRVPADGPTDRIVGDPMYMAPEQTILGTELDACADLYSLGLSFWEALCGHHPFGLPDQASVKALLVMQQERRIPPPSQVRAGLPDALAREVDAFSAMACAKARGDRFPTATAMRRALLELARAAESG